VVVLTGSPKVGVLSDRRVAEQFDKVLEEIPAQSAHLISDGAEDEYLFPILASRVPIDGVHRVYIRQSASLESTYYTFVKALKDPKLRAKTVLPFALVLLTLGLAAAAGGGAFWWGIIGLSIVLGIYLIFCTFDIDEAIIQSIRSASPVVRQGAAAFGFGFLAIAFVGVGFLQGYNMYIAHPGDEPIIRFLLFAQAGLIWWLVGAESWETGRAIRWYLARGRIPRSYPIATTSIIGIGFIAYGIVFLVQFLESFQTSATLPAIVAGIVLGLALVVGAGVLSIYLRNRPSVAGGGTLPG
jgi:putative membrane protein